MTVTVEIWRYRLIGLINFLCKSGIVLSTQRSLRSLCLISEQRKRKRMLGCCSFGEDSWKNNPRHPPNLTFLIILQRVLPANATVRTGLKNHIIWSPADTPAVFVVVVVVGIIDIIVVAQTGVRQVRCPHIYPFRSHMISYTKENRGRSLENRGQAATVAVDHTLTAIILFHKHETSQLTKTWMHPPSSLFPYLPPLLVARAITNVLVFKNNLKSRRFVPIVPILALTAGNARTDFPATSPTEGQSIIIIIIFICIYSTAGRKAGALRTVTGPNNTHIAVFPSW